MHLPEGSLDSSTVLMTTAVGMLALGVACFCVRRKLCPKQFPSLFGMTVFVLLAQTVNYATGFGYSGHWVGAGLLAIFFCPTIAMLSMAAVLGFQVSVLGEGSWLTLGANFINIGIVAPWTAHWVFKLLQGKRSPQMDLGQIIAVGIATFIAILFATLSLCLISSSSLPAMLLANTWIAVIEAVVSMTFFIVCVRGLEARLSMLRRFALKPIALLILLARCMGQLSSQQPNGVDYVLSPHD